jgi:hypothetical protein
MANDVVRLAKHLLFGIERDIEECFVGVGDVAPQVGLAHDDFVFAKTLSGGRLCGGFSHCGLLSFVELSSQLVVAGPDTYRIDSF